MTGKKLSKALQCYRGRNPVVAKGILIILMTLWIGGIMSCSTQKSDVLPDLPQSAKFPVLAIAHRGFSGRAPENTLTAFKKAIDLGVDMIEFDVLLSKDGQVVVIHDDMLNRTTNGKGKVADYTLNELKQLDAGSWFGTQFSGERIPTLKEVLELTRGQVFLNIELKKGDLGRYTMKDLADRSLQEVERAGMLNQILFASFDPSAIDRVIERNPRIPVGLIHSQSWVFPREVTGGRSISVLSCSGKVLTQTNISNAHKQGTKVMVWTLNTEEHMQHFLRMGVDGVITDYPDRLIEILQKKKR
jgi:glycerophosphoryl diester phosphodiesterase